MTKSIFFAEFPIVNTIKNFQIGGNETFMGGGTWGPMGQEGRLGDPMLQSGWFDEG